MYHYSKERHIQLIKLTGLSEEADYADKQHFWLERGRLKSNLPGSETIRKKIQKTVENSSYQEEAEYAIEHAKIDWSDWSGARKLELRSLFSCH